MFYLAEQSVSRFIARSQHTRKKDEEHPPIRLIDDLFRNVFRASLTKRREKDHDYSNENLLRSLCEMRKLQSPDREYSICVKGYSDG